MDFQRLFQPITINGMALKNRLVMPAIHHQYTPEGYATDRFNHYYWRRAEGGAALILVGGCALENHVGYADMMCLSDDKFIPGYQAFTQGMHLRGAKVAVQFMQTGRYGRTKYITGDDAAIAPSAVFSGYTQETPRAMTVDESVRYAKTRVTFGTPIAQFQALQFMMADMDIMTEAARQTVVYCIQRIQQGLPHSREAAICKCLSGDVAVHSAMDAVQILGGYGYSREYSVEKLVRDAKYFKFSRGPTRFSGLWLAVSFSNSYTLLFAPSAPILNRTGKVICAT